MKLSSDDFTIIKPSSGGGDGPGPSGSPPENVTPWSEDEEDGRGDSGSDSPGDSETKTKGKGEPSHEVTYGDGSGEGGETVDGGDMPSGGGLISEEDSKRLQKELGIPEKLPTMSKEQIREKLKKALGEPDAFGEDKTKSNKGGFGNSGGGNFRAAIAEIARGKIDWKRLLKKFIGSKPSGERQYLGNRRWLHSGDYMYGSKEKIEDIGSLVAAVDVSGSMGADEVAIILTEIKSLVRSRGIDHTVLVYFDHDIPPGGIVELKSKDAVKKYRPVRPSSGGTRFLPPLQVMDSYYKKGLLELAVFMTDGIAETDLPKPKFVSDFIWVVLNNPEFVPPWGNKVVHIKSSDVLPS